MIRLEFKIFRFDPHVDREPHYKKYTVRAEPWERLLDCLNRIRWEQDGTLSYRMSCAHGVCGSDGMKINGRCALACQKLVKDYQDAEVLLEPLPTFKVLKDLVVDLEPFFERVELVRPYLIATGSPEKERLQSPEERKKVDEVIRCILCACCTGACPVSNENPEFLGPATLVQAFRRIFDSRDEEQAERLKQLDYPDGVWGCVNHFECTRVCPKSIPVTKSINLMKREIEKG
ncbi:MAG TPA: succinate dehydrogenase iron-sulfur subunit [Desulfomonilaceae bacterium]|nr:succinate dehydrogenase iron-sulfur subunit [Desulfomonilaceae bacterium]